MTFLRFKIGSYVFAFLFRSVKQIMEKEVMVFGMGFDNEFFINDILGFKEAYAEKTEYLKFVFDSKDSIAINIPLPVRSIDIESPNIRIIPKYMYKFGFKEYLVGVCKEDASNDLIFLVDMDKAIDISEN